MQGRTNKTPKKELVIESPQQYKNTASCEGEVETVVQVLCIKTYNSDWHVVNYKYEDYSGDFRQLPNGWKLHTRTSAPHQGAAPHKDGFRHGHEILDTASLGSQKGGVTKHGWLYKGNMNSAISVTMRSFKRRYFHLTQLGDGSYNLNFYKDEKLSREPKGSIFLDSCMGVVQGARETEIKSKSESRLKLFTLDPDTQKPDFSGIEPDVKLFEEKFGKRLLVKCSDLSFNLQSCVAENEEGPTTNVEPFFVTLSLFDIQRSCKISADFHVDLNHPSVKQLIANASSQQTNSGGEVIMGSQRMPNGLPESMLQYTKQGIFSVTCPHPDIFLVARIEKVLQGGITHCAEPYMKSSDSAKAAQKVLKNAKLACSRLGQYKMPFAWAARPLFKDAQGTLDKSARFSAIYRQDSNKLSNEDLLKLLADFRKPEKMSKLPVILGNLDVTIDNVAPDLTNCVTSSYIPVKQFENNGKTNILFEVEEFIPCIPKYSQPFTIYNNHLYVYPKHLKYDSQKSFAKARNIAVCLEFRDSDDEDAQPVKCIYGRPGGPMFTKNAFAAVLHHQQNPEFYDEHHLLFTFYHVACDSTSKGSTKKKEQIETQVGYAWLPLLKDGRVIMNEQQIPVSANLPAGYLNYQEIGMGKHSGPEIIKWVDGGKPLFKIATHLVSTVYTQDQHLHNFFQHCQIAESAAQAPGGDLVKYLKCFETLALYWVPSVKFNNRVIIHVVAQCHEEGLEHYLRSYVKYVFKTEPYSASTSKTVHEELTKAMTVILKPSADFLTSNKLLKYSWFFFEALVKSMAQYLIESCKVKYSWFFFEALVKSMAQYLIESCKVKLSRNQRFSASFHHTVETLVNMLMPHISHKYKDNLEAARNANHSLAVFVKTLFEFKFEFLRVVCNHEHYIPLNLPMPFGKGRIQRFQDLQLDYSLTDDFCRNHFLVGLLLREVGSALQEFREIRQISISVLKSLMVKHAFDDRYASKSQQARTATLYLPLFGLLLENVHRLNVKDVSPFPVNHSNNNARDDSFLGNPTMTPQKPGNGMDNSLHKDVFGVISGTASPHASSTPNINSVRHADSRGSLISTDSGNSLPDKNCDKTNSLDKKEKLMRRHSASVLRLSGKSEESSRAARRNCVTMDFSLLTVPALSEKILHAAFSQNQQGAALGGSIVRCDKLDQSEIKSLLMCFLHVLKSMSEDALFTYWNKASPAELMDFFTLTEYMGKRYIARNQEGVGPIAHDRKSQTLPVSRNRAGMMHARLQQLSSVDNSFTFNHSYSHSDADVLHQSLLEANIATEVCFTVLDTLSIFTVVFKPQLCADHGHNPLMKKVFDVHLCFLRINQSEMALKQVFISLRTFIYKFPCTFFEGRADMCAAFCYEILKCCNSKLSSIRSDAAHLLYFLMKSNFDYTGRKSFVRTHLQVVIAVSQLIADVIGIGGTRFQHSLSIINNCANNDKTIKGCSAFRVITPNIDEEVSMMEDVGMQDVHFNEDVLMELLEQCADGLWKAERYELIADIYKLIIPIYEKRRDFEKLAHLYETLHRAYSKVTEVIHTGKRLLGTYFRVAFFGQGFFEDEDGKEYIYKEPKFTPLSEISQRLLKLYSDKFGQENVKIIQDSGKGFFEDEDGKEYIYKEPKFTPLSEISQRLLKLYSDKFGQENVKIIQDSGKKRIAVMYQHHTDLNPIEVAIDEMSKKVAELRQLCSSPDVDMIKLQLKLQGSVSVQVNVGPLAYARAFLDDASTKRFPNNKVKQLKEVFRQFVEASGHGLGINERLIKEDQLEYQEEMKANYREMARELSEIMHEQISPVEDGMKSSVMPNSLHIFNAISGTPSSTTVHGIPSSSSVRKKRIGNPDQRTIIYLSIVYTLGQVIMAISTIHDLTDTDRDGTPNNLTLHIALSMVGLILIALGTGGIKPCVAAFGGDQFEDHQEKQRSTFFSIFYLSINAGSLLSTVITPILRVVFIAGSSMYKKVSPQGNIMLKVCKCIGCESQQVATLTYIEDIQPNTIHMAWQIPQYFLMTVGEVVFSVTGLEFSYSQAPSNMKSVLQAGWLLTVAVGNIIVLIVAGVSQLPDQWAEYILFSALLVAVSIVFSIMAYFYTYVDPAEIEAQFDEEDKKKKDDHEMSTIPVYDNEAHFPKQSKM
ncbi:UNVERIFIED_CONTAM: hypothetical protein FKN15_049381 [Acipenser sinensis]